MRYSILAALVIVPLVSACTPAIPVKADFGTSALVPSGATPPEFAAFNAYDPRVGALVADQICATPETEIVQTASAAEPGQIVAWQGRCQTHRVDFTP